VTADSRVELYQRTRNLARTAVMAALTCLAGMALHWVPPALVPFSILPMFVFLAGIVLGRNYGALAMLVYVILGLFGLPVFALPPFGGIAYLAMPTFGYLVGYIAGAYVAGTVYRAGSLWRALFGALAGLAVLYVFGLAYLYVILNAVRHQPTGVMAVLAAGFLPFIVGDLLKAAVAAWVGNEVVRRMAAMN